MKTLQKISVILIIIICAIAILPQNVALASASDYVDGITTDDIDPDYVSSLQTIIGNILSFLQVASALASVLMIAIFGFNYITNSTPDGKQEYLQKFVPIVVGLVLVFGATTIAKFVLGIVGA